jgi:hypothetical protein
MCLEDQPCRLRRGGHHGVEGAKPEMHERAMARRERGRCAVRRELASQQAGVADLGFQLRGNGRKRYSLSTLCICDLKNWNI